MVATAGVTVDENPVPLARAGKAETEHTANARHVKHVEQTSVEQAQRARAEQAKKQEQLASEKAEREAVALAEKKKRAEREVIAARKEQAFRVQRLKASPIPKNRLKAEIEAKELEPKTFKEKRAAKLAAKK